MQWMYLPILHYNLQVNTCKQMQKINSSNANSRKFTNNRNSIFLKGNKEDKCLIQDNLMLCIIYKEFSKPISLTDVLPKDRKQKVILL